MNLPKEVTTVTMISKIIGGMVFILLPFIGFFLGMQYQKISESKPAYRDTLQINISPKPSPSVQNGTQETKQGDGPADVMTSKPLSLGLRVPAGATYRIEGDEAGGDAGITITMASGTVISMCTGCQVLIKGCDEEGRCVFTDTEIGAIPASIYMLRSEPGKVAAYLPQNQGDPIIRITTRDNTELTEEDKLFIEQMLLSAKRYSQDGATVLFPQENEENNKIQG